MNNPELERTPNIPGYREVFGNGHTHSVYELNPKLTTIAKQDHGIDLKRAAVPQDKTEWHTDFPDYAPVEADMPRGASSIRKAGDSPEQADPTGLIFSSLESTYLNYDSFGRPLNPIGRTGLTGRGMLDKWGPTQAADPIITRSNPATGKLEVLLIQRGDTGDLAFPGGKVDSGEQAWEAAWREAQEEAGVKNIQPDFKNGKVVYAGYIDDSRNTDNAWMESTAIHCHLNPEQSTAVVIKAASDADAAMWVEVTEELYGTLFSGQGKLLKLAIDASA